MLDAKRLIAERNVIIKQIELGGIRGSVKKSQNGYLVLINSSLSKQQKAISLRHELWHIALGHLDERKELPEAEKEKEVTRMLIEDTKKYTPAKREMLVSLIGELDLPTKIENGQYQFIPVKVAGVTFMSGETPRQEYLRKISLHEDPFSDVLEVNLEQYEYEGEPALAITVNQKIIGNVPRQLVQYLVDNKRRILGTKNINVYGGYDGKSYGCEIILVLKN